MTPSIKDMLCQCESPGTKAESQMWWCAHITPALVRRNGIPGLPARQPSLIGEPLASKRPCLQKEGGQLLQLTSDLYMHISGEGERGHHVPHMFCSFTFQV